MRQIERFWAGEKPLKKGSMKLRLTSVTHRLRVGADSIFQQIRSLLECEGGTFDAVGIVGELDNELIPFLLDHRWGERSPVCPEPVADPVERSEPGSLPHLS